MEIVYLLVPLSVLAVLGIGYLFVHAARSGQFDDLEGQGKAILDDEEKGR